jgi:hypothetical protein
METELESEARSTDNNSVRRGIIAIAIDILDTNVSATELVWQCLDRDSLPTIGEVRPLTKKEQRRRSLVLQILGRCTHFSHRSVLPSLDIHDGGMYRWCFRILRDQDDDFRISASRITACVPFTGTGVVLAAFVVSPSSAFGPLNVQSFKSKWQRSPLIDQVAQPS